MSEPGRKPGAVRSKTEPALDDNPKPEDALAATKAAAPQSAAAVRPRYTLEELLTGMTPCHQPESFDFGPMGEELL
jgi:hypothetical protein